MWGIAQIGKETRGYRIQAGCLRSTRCWPWAHSWVTQCLYTTPVTSQWRANYVFHTLTVLPTEFTDIYIIKYGIKLQVLILILMYLVLYCTYNFRYLGVQVGCLVSVAPSCLPCNWILYTEFPSFFFFPFLLLLLLVCHDSVLFLM